MISVIIPVYNSLPWLRRCIDSVLRQTLSDLEILLVDDGSTDGSGVLCEEYAKNDPRIRVVHQQNAGVSEARNTGLRNATGEYISFIDNDDWIHPQFFELLLKAILATDMNMAMCYYRTVWNDKFKPDTELITSEFSYRYFSRADMMNALLAIPIDTYRSSPVPYELIWGKLYKRELLTDMYYRNVWGEDAEYNSRLYLRIETVVLVPQYLYCWIQSPQSLHRSQSPEGFDGYLQGNMALLENIPPTYPIERSLALKRVMLCILASRHNVTKYPRFAPSKGRVLQLVRNVAGTTVKEFRKNNYISSWFKAAIMTFYYLPFTYDAFRWLADKKARMSK